MDETYELRGVNVMEVIHALAKMVESDPAVRFDMKVTRSDLRLPPVTPFETYSELVRVDFSGSIGRNITNPERTTS